MANLLQKVLVSATVGTVIGFSTILGAVSSASALTVESPEPESGPTKAISNIVFYLEDEGNITKLKIEDFSEESTSYNPENFLTDNGYSIDDVVAYTVKAGNNKDKDKESGMGPGEGELFILDNQFNESNLPKGATGTYPLNPTQADDTDPVEDNTSNNDNAGSEGSTSSSIVTTLPPQTNSSTQPVSVPEPGSIGAIAIFGLGGLLRKKKASS